MAHDLRAIPLHNNNKKQIIGSIAYDVVSQISSLKRHQDLLNFKEAEAKKLDLFIIDNNNIIIICANIEKNTKYYFLQRRNNAVRCG